MKGCWFHRWEAVRHTGLNVYRVCRKCGKRNIIEGSGLGCGYQPVDRVWLKTGRWTSSHRRPPKGKSPMIKVRNS